MPIELITTQGTKYAEDGTETRALIAWEHGECAMRNTQIDAIPRVRIVRGTHGGHDLAGLTGTLKSLTYDLTGERYDRYYNAWVQLDEPFVWTGAPGRPTVDVVCVRVEDVEPERTAA